MNPCSTLRSLLSLFALAFALPLRGQTLSVTGTTTLPQDTVATYSSISVESGGVLTIGGGSSVTVTGNLTVKAGGAVVCQGKNTGAKVGDVWAGAGVTLSASNVVIEATASLNADGQGYANGAGPGFDGTTRDHTWGASYGGRGLNNNGSRPQVYGSATQPVDLGSAGGIYDNTTCAGGGAIRLLVSNSLILNGSISANGVTSEIGSYVAGASGGSLWITTGSLSGSGSFSANASGRRNTQAASAGGRIAVYYADAASFAGFTAAQALQAPGTSAEDGSVLFVNTSTGAQGTLRISQRLRLPENTNVTYDAVQIDDGGVLEIGGGSTFKVTGLFAINAGGTVLCRGKNTDAKVDGKWSGAGVAIEAGSVTIASGGKLTADGQGYRNGAGPGVLAAAPSHANGAGFGGLGLDANGTRLAGYGDPLAPGELGSAGGVWTNDASAGGGAIRLTVAGTFTLNGILSANGTSAGTYSAGGTGGSLSVATHTLTGSGVFQADAATPLNTNASCSGGRIAVSYVDAHDYTAFTQASAKAGNNTAESGTIVFTDSSVAGHAHLHVFQNLRFPENAALSFDTFTVEDNGLLELGGGSTFSVSGDLVLAGTGRLLAHGKNVDDKVAGQWAGAGVTLSAANLKIAANARLTADGQGYINGAGPGFNGQDRSHVYGASYGGHGYNNNGSTPTTYGNQLTPSDLGSAGGVWTNADSSAGGGALKIKVANTLTLEGQITANGTSSGTYSGGATGGSLWITTKVLAGAGAFHADAAPSLHTNSNSSGGRIAVYYENAGDYTGFKTSSANGSLGTGASKGTVGFLDTTLANLHLRVFERWRTETGTSARYGKLSLSDAASYELGGGGRLTVDGLLDLQEGSELLVEGTKEGATTGGVIHAQDILVSSDSKITADGQGYMNGAGPGFNGQDRTHPYGASYGGTGYNINGGKPAEYGSFLQPVDFGSSGGVWTSADFAQAGGAVHLVVDHEFTLNGILSANGLSGGTYTSGATGGSLWVETHLLSGSGKVVADAAPPRNIGARCSGGRIALYFDDDSGFTGYNQCSAAGNGAPALDGTLVVINRSAPGFAVRLTQRLGIAANSSQTFGQLTLENGAVLDLGGGGEVKVTGDLVLNGTSKIVVHSKDTAAKVNGSWVGRGATITAGNLTVGAGASITADGEGYPYASGPGFAGTTGTHLFGASYGGRGNSANSGPPPVYGSPLVPDAIGSAGGRWTDSDQAVGGGAIRIVVSDTFRLEGSVSANGLSGGTYSAGATGGSLWVTTNVLRGAGSFKADAGPALNTPAASSGGRVAVYSKDSSAFTGFANSTANRGGTSAQHGTVLFLDSNTALPSVRVFQRFAVEEDTSYQFEALELFGTGNLEIGRAGLLRVENQLKLDDGAVLDVLCLGLNGGSVRPQAGAIDAGTMTVATGAHISADARGYAVAQGPGAPLPYSNYSNGGAAHGGKAKGARAGSSYGSAQLPIDPGSGGAIWSDETAMGGGALRIDISNQLVLDGTISADGAAKGTFVSGATGGSILVNAGSLSGFGLLTAKAAASNNTSAASGGGRIAVYTRNGNTLTSSQYSVSGGGDESTTGSLVTSNQVAVYFAKPVSTFVHGSSSVAWGGVGFDRRHARFDVTLSGASTNATLGTNISAEQGISWDSTQYPDGRYELHVIARDENGATLAEGVKAVALLNDLNWHTGNITADETWKMDSVHVVDGTCVVLTGVRVTIEPGAIVKFTPGSSLRVSTGAFLDVLAAGETHTILTDIADDTVGGDTNYDGTATLPVAGLWPGVVADGDSHVTIDTNTEIRFTVANHGGTLASSETWLGNQVHFVATDLVVPNGVSLTILPGAIVKFGPMRGISIASGGTLTSAGTVTQPVIFTSAKDDAIGGDTNGDGNSTAPAAGDWQWIFVEGTANFEHSHLLYSGGSPTGTWSGSGALRTNGNAKVTFKNSTIKDAFFDGILNWGGPLRVENALIVRADRGIAAHPAGVLDVVNSTVVGCREGVLCHGGTLTVSNSVVAFCSEAGIQYDFGTLAGVSYTDVWNPASAAKNYVNTTDVTGVTGDLSRDPLFRNLARDDYHLTRLSPAIDSANGSLAPAADNAGVARYDDPKVTNTGTNGAADLGAFEYAETAPSTLDLAIVSIDGPAKVLAGSNVSVSWVVTNVGKTPILGNWHDRLSLQPAGDTNAPLTFVDEQVASSSLLNPGQSVFVSKTVRVPFVLDGTYKWVVDVNAKDEVFEGQNHENNHLRSLTNSQVELPSLALGESVTESFVSAGSPFVYKVTPATATQVALSLLRQGTGGWTRLAVSKDRIPTLSDHEVLSQNWNTPNASTEISTVAGEALYVAVYPVQLPSTPLSFTLSAQPASFSLTGTDVLAGSTKGKVSLPLHGAGFSREAVVQLKRSSDGTLLSTSDLRFVDGTLLVVTFDLTSAAAGQYDVVVTQNSTTRTLANTFTVNGQPKGELRTAVLMPPQVRAGRKYVAWIEYQNTGSTDLLLPIVGVSSTDGLTLALDADDEGATDISFVATAPTGLPWILPPGASGRTAVTFTAKPGSNHIFTTVTTTESTASMNWERARLALRPKINLSDTWDSYWDLAAATYGNTSGGYARWALASYQLWHQRTGEVSPDLAPALAYWLQDAAEHATAGVEATVLLGDGVTPAANVTVSLLNKAGEFVSTATTAHNGFARFPSLTAGTYYILADGYLPPVGGNTFTVATHSPLLTPTWKLPAGGTLSGIVRLNGALDTSTLSVVAEDASKNLFVAPGVDALGRFTIRGLPGGTYTATLLGDGLVPVTAGPVVVTENALASLGELSVVQQGMLKGFVKKASSGEPLAGANVLARSTEGKTSSAVTDATGAYTLTKLSAGAHQVFANASGYLGSSPLSITVTAANAGNVPELLLSEESVLKGTVSSTGTPLGGVSVSVVDGTKILGEAATASDGTYEVHGLMAGTFGVVVRATAYARLDDSVTLTSATTAVKDYSLVSVPAPKLHVKNGNSAQGIPSTALRITAPDGTQSYAMTNSAGDLLLGQLTDGTYTVSLADGSSSRVITITGGVATGNLTFELTIGALKGRVFASDGLTPLLANVSLLAGGKVVAAKTTNAFGDYSFAGLAPGTYTVKATSDNAFFIPLANLHVAADATTIVADLVAPTHTLDVTVTGITSGAAGMVFLSTTDGEGSVHSNRILDTDNLGQVRFTNLAPGTYQVFANTTSGFSDLQTITISEGANHLSLPVIPTGTLSGLIRNHDLAPSNGARLVVVPSTGPEKAREATTRSDGTYTLDGLPAGTYSVWLVAPEDQQAPEFVTGITVAANQTTTFNRIYSYPQGHLQGTVATSDGSHPQLSQVQLRTANGIVLLTRDVSSDGSFQLPGVPAGSYVLCGTATGFTLTTQALTLGDLQTVDGLTLQASWVGGFGSVPTQVGAAAKPGQYALSWDFTDFDNSYLQSMYNAAASLAKRMFGEPPFKKPNLQNPFLHANLKCPCPEAFKSWNKVQYWQKYADLGWDYWHEQWEAREAEILANAGLFGVNVGKLAGSLLAASFKVPQEIGALKSMAETARIEMKIHKMGSTAFGDALAAYNNFSTQLARLESLFTNPILTNNVGTVGNLATGFIQDNYNGGPQGWAGNIQSVIETLADPTSVFADTSSMREAFDKVVGFVNNISGIAGALNAIATNLKGTGIPFGKLFDKLGALTDLLATVSSSYDALNSQIETWKALKALEDTYNWRLNERDYWYNICLMQIERCRQNNKCDEDPKKKPKPPSPDGGKNGGDGNSNGVGSFDPNDKTSSGVGAAGYITPGTPIYYDIHFENLATASAAAQLVTVVDTLPAELDWSTFELVSINFNGTTLTPPSGTQAYQARASVTSDPNPVDVSFTLDATTGVATWALRTVDALSGDYPEDPFAGFLPPNDSTGRGEGNVTFLVRPKANLADGTTISNQAWITFDANTPIDTPVARNTIDRSPASASLAPLATRLGSKFVVSWSGADAGSGVARYELWYSTDGGAFALWSGNITTTSAIFEGSLGHTYSFYVRAFDALGQAATLQAVAQTSTTTAEGVTSSHLVNLSTRGFSGSGEKTMIAGFVIRPGTNASLDKHFLVRAVGPTLGAAPFNVAGALADPVLELFDSSGATLMSVDDWKDAENASSLAAESARIGAFPLPDNSLDAGFYKALPPGLYTAHVQTKGVDGVSLLEMYDTDSVISDPAKPRLMNLSGRAYVDNGSGILIAGFVINGDAPKSLLLRAVGPSLALDPFKVPGVLEDPIITLVDKNGITVAQNDNWEDLNGAAVSTTAAHVGAFPVPSGSKDAALVITLLPGQYTLLVSGKDGGKGVAIVEIYDAD